MRLTISVPDELASRVRELRLPISAICQKALGVAAGVPIESSNHPRKGSLMNSYEVTVTIKTEIRHNAPADAISEACEAIRQGFADNITAAPEIVEVHARRLSGDDE